AVFDRWVQHVDNRQAVVFRDPSESGTPKGRGTQFLAQMIDNEPVLGGQKWSFGVEKEIDFRTLRIAGGSALTRPDFVPWIERVIALQRREIEAAADGIPQCWIAGDEAALCDVLQKLDSRRSILFASMRRALNAHGIEIE